ncbi:MAG: protoporphyrinogen oxidase, partial [Nitrospira sp.]|nr:protoporphyrinogen oxidase [Nitrospira sp.]
RLRIIYEIFSPKGARQDETLADFARRRLGNEAYEKLIDPMASGIFAGDPETMSLKSCFPRIHEIENKYGSLIRAMIKLQKEGKKSGKKVGPGPGGILTSFYDGMEVLIKVLKNHLGGRLRTGSRVVSVDKKKDTYLIFLDDGSKIETEGVVLTVPSYACSEILKDLDKALSSTLEGIIHPAISVICLGYKKERIKYPLDGFGFLIPRREGKKILGTLWDSSIFPNRAPEGYVLLRSMVGGARSSDLALQDRHTLAAMVMDTLEEVIGIKAQPDMVKVYTHEKGIPQYLVGHARRLEAVEKTLKNHRGLYLTGNSYRGIGVNDCIENSYKLSERIVEEL